MNILYRYKNVSIEFTEFLCKQNSPVLAILKYDFEDNQARPELCQAQFLPAIVR